MVLGKEYLVQSAIGETLLQVLQLPSLPLSNLLQLLFELLNLGFVRDLPQILRGGHPIYSQIVPGFGFSMLLYLKNVRFRAHHSFPQWGRTLPSGARVRILSQIC